MCKSVNHRPHRCSQARVLPVKQAVPSRRGRTRRRGDKRCANSARPSNSPRFALRANSGITQDGISRLEQPGDLPLLPMRKTGETMGGSFSLIARFPERRPVDRLVSPSKRAEPRASHSLYFTVTARRDHTR